MLRELPQAAGVPLLSLLAAIGGEARLSVRRWAIRAAAKSGQVGPVARGGRSVHVGKGRRGVARVAVPPALCRYISPGSRTHRATCVYPPRETRRDGASIDRQSIRSERGEGVALCPTRTRIRTFKIPPAGRLIRRPPSCRRGRSRCDPRRRAKELVREAEQLRDERHDEYDILTRVAKLVTGPRERGALGDDVPQSRELAIA